MSLIINIREVQKKETVLFHGEMNVEELGILGLDECIHPALPLKYDLTVQLVDSGILVEGGWSLRVDFECVRCLKKFARELGASKWSVFLALKGEEQVEVSNDCVDLTPILREDILLAFPQHPLCELGCPGLPKQPTSESVHASGSRGKEDGSSVWDELDKLKL